MKKHLILRGILALVLVLAMLPSAALATTTVYFNQNSRVYQNPSASSFYLPVSQGFQCELVNTYGGIAVVKRGKYTAYTPAKHLSYVGAQTAPGTGFAADDWWTSNTSGPTTTNSGMSFISVSKSAYISTATKVYASPSTSALSANAKAGVYVTLTGYDSSLTWARIELNGYTAYIPCQYLSPNYESNYNLTFKNDSQLVYINTPTEVYQYPSTAAKSVSMRLGTVATMTGYDSDKKWARVMRNGFTAYIPYQYLNASTSRGSKDFTELDDHIYVRVNDDDAEAYRYPNKSSSTVIMSYDFFYVTGYDSTWSWARIEYKNKTLYIPVADLSDGPYIYGISLGVPGGKYLLNNETVKFLKERVENKAYREGVSTKDLTGYSKMEDKKDNIIFTFAEKDIKYYIIDWDDDWQLCVDKDFTTLFYIKGTPTSA